MLKIKWKNKATTYETSVINKFSKIQTCMHNTTLIIPHEPILQNLNKRNNEQTETKQTHYLAFHESPSNSQFQLQSEFILNF